MVKRVALILGLIFLFVTSFFNCYADNVINYRFLRNARYGVIVLDELREIQLKEGEYDSGTSPLEDENYIYVKLDKAKIVDLNGDDVLDALTILYISTGGSAAWVNLTGFMGTPAEPVRIEPFYIGDRVVVKELRSKKTASGNMSLVCLKMLTHGPKDPSCCPTKKETKCFNLISKQGKWFFEEKPKTE